MTQLPRGVRVNNPGLAAQARDSWGGEVMPSRASQFMTFDSMAHGVPCTAKILLGYQARGLTTVSDIIGRWASPVENDTAAYMKAVANACGVTPTTRVSLGENMLARLWTAIFHHENGGEVSPRACNPSLSATGPARR